MTIYYPEGFDIRIEVIRGLNSYTATIGDEYTENFSYYYDWINIKILNELD